MAATIVMSMSPDGQGGLRRRLITHPDGRPVVLPRALCLSDAALDALAEVYEREQLAARGILFWAFCEAPDEILAAVEHCRITLPRPLLPAQRAVRERLTLSHRDAERLERAVTPPAPRGVVRRVCDGRQIEAVTRRSAKQPACKTVIPHRLAGTRRQEA